MRSKTMENIGQNHFLQLDEELSKLRRISSGLRLNGLLTFLATLTNLAVTAFLLSRYATAWDNALLLVVPFRLVPLLAGLLAILCVALYEYLLRQGNILFDEISDELEWNVKGSHLSEGGALTEKRPDLKVRMILRMFSRANDLPLFPGAYGPAIYVLLNLGLFFIGYLAR